MLKHLMMDNQQTLKHRTDSDSLRKRVNHLRDSDQKKGRKTETELSVGISDNKKSETIDTTHQARSQTELDANKTTEVEKILSYLNSTDTKANYGKNVDLLRGEIKVHISIMDLSEFISRCQSDEIETFSDEEINNAHAEFRRKMMGVNEAFRIKPVCFENFIYYLRNERWSDARVFRSGAIKEYLMLPSNRKFPKQNKDNQATDSDSLRKRVNHLRDSDQKKGRKTETELSMGISDNKKSETIDTTHQARSQTELDANKTTEVEKGPILSEQTESQANSELNEEEKRLTGSESELGDKYENENKSTTHTLEAIVETNSIENAMVLTEQDDTEQDEEKTNATEADEKERETSKPED